MAEASSASATKSDEEKVEMLDWFLTRLALCDDSNLQPLLSKLLPFTISSLSSQSSAVRNKVLEKLSFNSKCNRHPRPFLHRELPAPPSQQGLNGTTSTKRHHAFAANTDGPSSWNRGPNNFNVGASSMWGAGEEIVVRIRVLRARDDEFDLGFHELSLCISE